MHTARFIAGVFAVLVCGCATPPSIPKASDEFGISAGSRSCRYAPPSAPDIASLRGRLSQIAGIARPPSWRLVSRANSKHIARALVRSRSGTRSRCRLARFATNPVELCSSIRSADDIQRFRQVRLAQRSLELSRVAVFAALRHPTRFIQHQFVPYLLVRVAHVHPDLHLSYTCRSPTRKSYSQVRWTWLILVNQC